MMEKIKEEFYELSFCISNKLPLRRALVRSFLSYAQTLCIHIVHITWDHQFTKPACCHQQQHLFLL